VSQENSRACRHCGKVKPINNFGCVNVKRYGEKYRRHNCNVCYKVVFAAQERARQQLRREAGLPSRTPLKSCPGTPYAKRSRLYKLSNRLARAEKRLAKTQQHIKNLKEEIKQERRERTPPLTSTPVGV